MLAAPGSSLFFKRTFMALFITTFIKSSMNSLVNDNYFDALQSVENIKTYKWSKFLLDRLFSAKTQWSGLKQTFFKGSLIFLSLFYLDRVKIGVANVECSIPSLLNWDDKKINDRQKIEMEGDGFGKGRILDRLHMADAMQCNARLLIYGCGLNLKI